MGIPFSTAKSHPLVAGLYPAWETSTLSPNQGCMSEDEGPERHAEPGMAWHGFRSHGFWTLSWKMLEK